MDIKDYLEMEPPASGDGVSRELREYLKGVPLTDLIEHWDSLTDEMAFQTFMALELESRVWLMGQLSYSQQEVVVKSLSEQSARALLAELMPDDLTDFLQAVSPEVRRSVWNNLSEDAKRESLFLLRFDEDDAAGLMTPRYLAIRAAVSVGQALAFVRKNAVEVETIHYLYVVDELERLLGVIALQDLLASDDEVVIKEIMDTDYISVQEDTDREETARILEAYDLTAIPVLDKRDHLLGIVTIDDILGVIHEEHTEDVYKMGAMRGETDRYLDTSIWGLVKKRVPWLIILLLLGTITTSVLDHYQNSILGATFLLLFIPVITQTGGNSGGQSATLMIRGLATGEIHPRDARRVVVRELLVGLLLGVATGAVILARSYFVHPVVELQAAVIVGCSLCFVVLFSTVIGAVAPILLSRLGLDPTVMSTPLITTVIDVFGLTIYFEIAGAFLRL